MRIKQARISSGVINFKKYYLEKYNLVEGNNFDEPIVLFGMYNMEDYRYYLSHRAPMVVVWCGTDGLMLKENMVEMLKCKIVKHIAKSKFISNDLSRYGIDHLILPVSWQTLEINPISRGEKIFHYSSGQNNFYGDAYLPEIRSKTGCEIIETTINTYTKDMLKKVYGDCFIGLRLTKHDGIPNTVIELGMMGRRCIYNGDIPNAIPWLNIDDICENVKKEYCRRNEDDIQKVAEETAKYIDIGDGWLNV